MLLYSCSQKNESKDSSQEKVVVDYSNDESIDLTKYGIADYPNNVLGGLNIGDIAPEFKLSNQFGKSVSLKETLKSGPVVLVYYRADWCPYCTKHLAEFQESIMSIQENGNANVIAISPQTSEYSKILADENGYTFPILYDIDHVAMKDYKVFFKVTEEYNEKVYKYKGDYIQTRNDDTNPYLPVPATYVIGQDQIIKYVHYDPDYSERADIDQVLGALDMNK